VEEALNAIRTYQPTFLPAVPTMYIALLNHPRAAEAGLGSIRLCNSGAAPLPVEVIQQFARFSSGAFIEGYGLTEASPITHINPIMNLKKLGSIGLPIPDTDARIVDVETGTRELGPGEIGELIIKGPQVMKGYWNRPEETAQTLRDGWLYTGDIARMDEDGYFYIVDRKKDMILTGGFNVYPREVEEVLYAHPAVLEAAVVGVPDPYRGEAVKAYVVLKPGAQASEEEILEHCRKNLAPYKVPRSVEFRDYLPKSMVGKVLRRMLREAAPAIAAPSLTVPPDVPIRAFFMEWVPRLSEAAVAAAPPEGMEGTTLIVRYRVDGEVFTLRVEDGRRLTVVEGETEETPHVELILHPEALREVIAGRLYMGDPPYLAFQSRRRFEALQRLKGTVRLDDVGEEVEMGEHHPLGQAGGPARVGKDGDVLHRVHGRLEEALPRSLHQVRPAVAPRTGRRLHAHPLGLDPLEIEGANGLRHGILEAGEDHQLRPGLLAHGHDLRGHRVQGDQRPHPAVFHHVAELPLHVEGVQRDHHGAQAEDSIEGDEELGAVREHDPDSIPGPDSQGVQRGGQANGMGPEIPIGHLRPVEDRRGAIPILIGREIHEGAQGLPGIGQRAWHPEIIEAMPSPLLHNHLPPFSSTESSASPSSLRGFPPAVDWERPRLPPFLSCHNP